MSSCTGRIFLSPKGSKVDQFWINIGYDTYDGYQIPEWIPAFQPICSKQQYDDLMANVERYFQRNCQSSCCTFIIRHRPSFDQGLERVLRNHQQYSQRWKLGDTPTLSPWKPGTLKYAYIDDPVSIAPNRSYDSRGNVLVTQVEVDGEFIDTAAWPPPYYNIVLNIPPRIGERIRNRWPGENPLEKIESMSPRSSFSPMALVRSMSKRPAEATL